MTGQTVLSARSRSSRFPYTTCSDAEAMTELFAGAAITNDILVLNQFAKVRSHCTHRFDIVALAIAQAARGPSKRQYDVTVQTIEGQQRVHLVRDGAELMHWSIEGTVIRAQHPIDGRDIRHALSWASATGDDNMVEAVAVMRRGLLVSRYCKTDPNRIGPAQNEMSFMAGACFVFQPELAPFGNPKPNYFFVILIVVQKTCCAI